MLPHPIEEGGVWLLIIFSSLCYPSFCFIPMILQDKDDNWKFSRLFHQNLSPFENSAILHEWMIGMCNFVHDCVIICFYWYQMNNNSVRKSKRKICRKRRKKGNIVSRVNELFRYRVRTYS